MKARIWFSTTMACAAIAFAGDVSAAVWQWGCVGPVGKDQIVFNRNQLLVLPGKMPHRTLDRLIFLDDLTKDEKLPKDADADIVGYNADDGNSGLDKQMTFTRNDRSDRKLTLTEKSSKLIAHRIVHGCRDEITDRFRKVYRYKTDDAPQRDVTLECIDYNLTTRGGRSCN
jgi:hypothetical protein